MNQYSLISIAFLGGILLAAQGGLNAQLGVFLKNPLLASLVAFFFSFIFVLIYVLANIKNLPTLNDLKNIPTYLWFTGALFSVLGVSLYYYTIPKLGISTMISLGLIGQLLFSVVAGHFGWLNLPTEPISIKKMMGVISMIIGILLINLK